LTALPDSIIQNGLFCCWKYEERNGRKTKVPYQPQTGLGAKSNDPSSFVPYKTAVQASGYDGIGIGIFNGICAIDLDNCVSDSGYYTQTAAEIVALMHSYTEYSPSGNGLHILFSAKGFQYDTKRFYIMNHQAGIEVYVAGATNKYVTVTGNRCEDYEYGDRTQELQVLLDKLMRRPEVGAENAINAKNSDLSMEQLLQLAKSSKNGPAFTALWNGSLEGYLSPSEADLALCSHLAFWTGRDAAKMDTMFRQSGLMRDKWDRQQSGTTYGAITIQKAIEHCREIYTPKAESSPVFQPIVPLTPQWSDLPAFPVDALPDVIRNYVSAVAEHSQTATDMAAVISLGVLATCLQGKGCGVGIHSGKGNPHNENGINVSYMWEDILKKDTVLYLIDKIIFLQKETKKDPDTGKRVTNETLIFPRYHQFNAVRKLVADVVEHHSEKNYLIEHSAGSGKTNTIAWLAHRLASLHDRENKVIFDTVCIITDRIVVDRQLQNAVLSLEHKAGLIKVMDEKCTSKDLADALNGNTKIIVTTIHKFMYIQELVQELKSKTFAVIIDEAHSSTAGTAMEAVT